MKLKAQIRGADTFKAPLAKLSAIPGLEGALRQAAEAVRADAIKALNEGRPPGSAGALAESLIVTPGASPLSYRVSTALNEGWRLEFGGKDRAAMPWLEPALEKRRAGFSARLREALKSMTGKSI